MNEFILKSIRKMARIFNYALSKMLRFLSRVDNKTTRMLTGVDISAKLTRTATFEKIYFSGIPQIKPIAPSMPAIGSKPSVTLFIPSLGKGSFFGGTATALVVAAKFAIKSNRQLRIVQTVQTAQTEDLSSFFHSEDIDSTNLDIKIISVADREYNVYGYIPMHIDDIFIASAWWDAYIINNLPVKKFVYLIQDFEPIFYNNSDAYTLAEKTYESKKIIPLCNTKLMFDFMHGRGYEPFSSKNSAAHYFEPAVSRINSGKLINKSSNEKKRLFLYGRPSVDRNLFFTAIDAISLAIKNGYINAYEYEFFMAGQNDLPDIEISSGVIIKNLGKMSMSDYAKFSKTVDVAVSPMMAPHPNYPTLEFASIGSAVVTTKYANKQTLNCYSKNIFMSDTNAESISEAINMAAKKSYPEKIRDIKFNNFQSSWDTSLDKVINEILKKINK